MPEDGIFLILEPEETRNYCQNPSFGIDTTGYAPLLGAGIARDLSQSRFGRASGQVQTAAVIDEGIEYNVDLSIANEFVTFSVYLRGEGQVYLQVAANDNVYTVTGDPITLEDTHWVRASLTISIGPIPETDFEARVRAYEAQAEDFYVDGWQIERKAYPTTYVDGDLELELAPHDGFPYMYWVGQRHVSDSIRIAKYREGGRWRNLIQGLNFDLFPITMQGIGMPPIRLGTQSFGGMEKAVVQSIRSLPRSVGMQFYAVRDLGDASRRCVPSLKELNTARRALEDQVKPDAKGDMQPFLIRYNEGKVPMDLEAYYEAGMEWQGDIRNSYENAFMARLFCPDPYWRADTQDVVELEPNATPAVNHAYLIAKEGGVWNGFGGADAPVRVIKVHPNGDIYAGGDFTSIGAVAAGRIARYDGEQWNALAGGNDIDNGTVNAIAFAPNGDVYIGGSFTTINAVPYNRLARYTPATDTFAVLDAGTPGVTANAVEAIAIAADGTVYIGGSFLVTTAGLTVNYICSYDPVGDAFALMGGEPGLDSVVYALEMDIDGETLYIGGNFTQEFGLADGALEYVCRWTTDYEAMAEHGMDDVVHALKMSLDGRLFAGGDFTGAGFWNVERCAYWNRNDWYPLGADGDGLPGGNRVNVIEIDRRGNVIFGGDFTSATNAALASYIATWDGSRFGHIDLRVGAEVFAIAVRLEDWFVGYNGAAVTTSADVQTVSNTGRAKGNPFLDVLGPLHLMWLENQDDGAQIRFDLEVQAGERVVVDLRPGSIRAVSDFRGNVMLGILANSDIGKFKLNPGDNRISFMGTDDLGATEISLRWRVTQWSFDDIVR